MTKITSPRKEICRENIGATMRINANIGEKEASRNAPKEGQTVKKTIVLSLRDPAGVVAISQNNFVSCMFSGEYEIFLIGLPRRCAPRNDTSGTFSTRWRASLLAFAIDCLKGLRHILCCALCVLGEDLQNTPPVEYDKSYPSCNCGQASAVCITHRKPKEV